MTSTEVSSVDLTNCDKEPIHLLGKVQRFGFLVGLTSDWIISHVSENASDFIEEASPDLIGSSIDTLFPHETIHALRNRLQHVMIDKSTELITSMPVGDKGEHFDLSLHVSSDTVVVEAERSENGGAGHQYLSNVRTGIERLSNAKSSSEILSQAVRFTRALTGFDRVMLYKFRADDSGEVVAESASAGLKPFLGLRYPATDIPKQARALYVLNPIRIITDVSESGAHVVGRLDGEDLPVLDLSQSVLRSVSEIHLEYLRNMGVGASMSISIVIDGKLWGLIACHHNSPYILSAPKRNAILLFSQMLSLVLQNKLVVESQELDDTVFQFTSQLSQMAGPSAPVENLLVHSAKSFMNLLSADGFAVVREGGVELQGKTPSKEECLIICRQLPERQTGSIYSTSELAIAFHGLEHVTDRAAGLIAVPVSRSPRDYILFFRKELVQKVEWAGQPDKAVTPGPNGIRLTPRKSFEAWQQLVTGQSEAWRPADLRAAEQLRITLLEVVLRLTDEVARERATANERQELLIAELNHRVKNILGLVRGLISQSGANASSTAEFVKTIDRRIHALARAHDQITREHWMPSSLKNLIKVEAESYFENEMARFEISGSDVLLEPTAFSTMALVMHEMVTNSAKYGALSDQAGKVYIDLNIDEEGALALNWRESGGPAVKAPTRRGFGSTIIERSIPYELGGDASISYELTGVSAQFIIPARYVTPNEISVPEEQKDKEITSVSADGAVPAHVLVVEDNLIIAMEAENILLQLGCKSVTVFPRTGEAISHLQTEACDFALLDIHLGDETSMPVAEELKRRGIPFAFASGYGEGADLPETFDEYAKISKPFTKDTIASVLRG